MPDDSTQITFELRVLQYALTIVISEEDADSLAKLILRLTGGADTWMDPNIIQGQQLALKALICDEVMRVYKIEAGQGSEEDGKGAQRSFANIYKELSSSESVLDLDPAWIDYVKYSPPSFKVELLRGLETRLSSFNNLGPI
jgi:hypothetical protein